MSGLFEKSTIPSNSLSSLIALNFDIFFMTITSKRFKVIDILSIGELLPMFFYTTKQNCVGVLKCLNTSVADPGYLSRIPDPDFYPFRIPDPKTATKERGEKKFDVIPFYVATNFTKLYIILVFKC